MKKNKLIELLNSIEGNPDIYIWNGFVGDYQDIDPKLNKTKLVKESKEFLKKAISLEYKQDNQDIPEDIDEIVDEAYKDYDWRLIGEFDSSEAVKRICGKNVKNVVVISPKRSGKTYSDRIGTVEY